MRPRACFATFSYHFCSFLTFEKMGYGVTDGPTNGLTDGLTDGHTLLQRCEDASKKVEEEPLWPNG